MPPHDPEAPVFWSIAIIVIIALFLTITDVIAESDYTNRAYTDKACELFAWDAAQAAEKFQDNTYLPNLLEYIESSEVAPARKERARQAIQYVWKHQIDNPQLAYTLAMGACLEPKSHMAPLDDLYQTSPRTTQNFF